MLRLGIIGAGGIASLHTHNILSGKCPEVQLTAMADRKESRREWIRATVPDAAVFCEGSDLIASDTCDAVLIATPHYQHPTLAIEAFRHGKHVLCEKPAGVYTLQVRDMIAEADKHPELTFGMMFNQRTNCVYRKAKALIDSGALGEIKRMIWVVTDWYRTQSYYDAEPLFTFGEGIGYAPFVYRDLAVDADSLTLSVKVRNAGDIAGEETVQVYLRDCVCEVMQPVKQLIAFRKVLLQPGEEQEVVFHLDRTAFTYINRAEERVFAPGDFMLMAGHSAKDEDLLKETVWVG